MARGRTPTEGPHPPDPGDDGVASGLLAFARGELGDGAIGFAEPPAPVSGGFDTRIFAFRLHGAPPAAAGPLILRILSPHHDPARALRERAVQNAIADLGYPAPRAPWAAADTARFGGAFLVMERMPGRPLLAARRFDIAGAIAGMQARLHDLSADALLRACDAATPPVPRETLTFDGYLAQLDRRIAASRHTGLRPAMRWLEAHRPPPPSRPAICHGDFHPQNLLYEGRVTGVLDWPNALVADPAYDVAATRTILGLAPIALVKLSPVQRWVVRRLRPILVRRYLAAYRRRRPISEEKLTYYEAASIMRALVRACEDRTSATGPVSDLDKSSYPEDLSNRFAEITGIRPALPPNR